MYERAKELLRLATWMQGSTTGVTLDDIRTEFAVSRRTAERMLDAVRELFGEPELRPSDDNRIHRSLPLGALTLLAVSAEELAHLQGAAALLQRENRPDAAASLASVESKLRAAMRRDTLRRVEPDLELLTETQGLAARPGPRPRIDRDILAALRDAMLKSAKIRIRYRSQSTGAVSRQKICPYGFLYGAWPYLVAFSLNPAALDFRTYRLSNIVKVELLGEIFSRDPAFSLDAYARRSFGVFQEEPFDVAWKFSPAAAGDARDYVFHPDQTMEEQPDGSLIVRFHAGGAREMAWHLYTWGDQVEVLEPEGFKI